MVYTFQVGGLEHFLFFHILGIAIPTDFHIFQRGRYTTNQKRNGITAITTQFLMAWLLISGDTLGSIVMGFTHNATSCGTENQTRIFKIWLVVWNIFYFP